MGETVPIDSFQDSARGRQCPRQGATSRRSSADMLSPRGLLALAVFCSVLAATHAKKGNCELLHDDESIGDITWDAYLNVTRYEQPLKDTALPGFVYLVLSTKAVTGLEYVSPSDYIDVELNTGASTLSLVVTEAFERYENDMISASDPSLIEIKISLSCSDGNSDVLPIKIGVEDVNTHPPEFEKPSYEYKLPMPLPSDIDLSCLVGVINVKDIDFTNSLITVEFDGDGLQLLHANATYQTDRSYTVHIYSRTSIELKETTTFNMIATDGGDPQLSSAPASVTIKVNQETSPPTAPKFEWPAYHETVRTGGKVEGTPITSVTISEGYDTDVTVTHRTLDDAGLTASSNMFTVKTTPGAAGKATVSLRWADGVKAEDIQDLKYALIVVEATRNRVLSANQTAATVIHLSLPGLEDPLTTACPTPEPTTTVSPETTTECPTPEPCICTTVSPETTTECPTPDPCICTTVSPETTTVCPTPDPCNCTTTTAEPTSTTPDISGSSTTPESTTCPNNCVTDPTWTTVPYPQCSSSDVAEPCICSAPSHCTTVETTTPGSPTGSTESSGSPTTCPTIAPTSPNTDSPTGCPECPTTCTPCESCPTAEPTSTTPALPPGPLIEFENARYSKIVASDYHGDLLDLKLKDSGAVEGYTLVCQVDAADDLASRLSANAAGTSGCQLSADVFLSPGSYSLAVIASLAGTSSSATAQVALGVTVTVSCNASTPVIFSHALALATLPENPATPQTIVPAAQLSAGAGCSFTRSAVDPSLYRDWVTVDEATGEVSVKDLDYEKVTSLVISLSVTCDTQQQQEQQLRTSRDLFSKEQPEWPRELLYDVTSMSVLLQIEDLNDNDPVFTAGDRLVVGYPTGGLLERIQPGPVVTLTATDADDGENAALRYRLDATGSERFTVQEETGTIYLRADADLPAEGAEFTATVLDLAGAQGARTDSMQVQVKPLYREDQVLVMTVEGALPEDADTVVETLGGATGLAVRLLRAYAAAAEGSRSHARAGAARADAGAALTLMLYALDDQGTPINVAQFQKLLSSSEVELPWEVSKVENLPPEAENQDPTDVTGYMAAIITLAVLIALAIVGVGAGYYFYFRPRMGIQKHKDGYTEFTSGADKPSPLESQIPQIVTDSEIIEPVNKLTIENNISKHENSNGVLAPGSDDDWPRKRSVNIRGGPDDYDGEAQTVARKSESSDSIDGDEAQAEPDQRKSSLDEDEARAEAERRKSTVHFNENVECIEVDRL